MHQFPNHFQFNRNFLQHVIEEATLKVLGKKTGKNREGKAERENRKKEVKIKLYGKQEKQK